MDNKEKRNLTSRERKQLREDEKNDIKPEKVLSEVEVRSIEKRRKIFAVALLVVAIVAIVVGASIPAYMACNYMYEKNPVAVIELKSGNKKMTMKYELFVENAPNAVNNFAYLASIDFFDGAVIYDTQNDWVRFGGYRLSTDKNGNASYTHISKDEAYTKTLLDDFTEQRYDVDDHSGIFKYKLIKDDSSLYYNTDNMEFALCANYSGSAQASTEFQISASTKTRSDTVKDQDGKNAKIFSTGVFALPLNNDKNTKYAINYILSLERSENKINKYFNAPINEPVIITDVIQTRKSIVMSFND